MTVPVEAIDATAYTIPTDKPEADGTIAWNSTTIVIVALQAGGQTGLGYTYSSETIVPLIRGKLAALVLQADAMNPPALCDSLRRTLRNIGVDGIGATAISAIDTALWDLKARLLGVSLAALFGQVRDEVPIYGSGGFTTYSDGELREQLGTWVERDGCRWVKMKIGSQPGADPHRIATATGAIGDAALFVDANGAFRPKQALHVARAMADVGVAWFEEPVSSDDLEGLALLRQQAPMDIAAGEYAYTPEYVARMVQAGAVDVQQADVTRCLGFTGWLRAAALCDAHQTDLSGHCAPALHLHAACAAPRLRHLEWFHDHVLIEHMLFEGAPVPRDGRIAPDLSRPGHGLAFRRQDAEPFRVAA